ncbi:MAG: hypothetical protein ACR2N3_15360 [Pyrinomonadaceae bacterium]
MKFLSESRALAQLEKIKSAYRGVIQNEFEPKAKNCLTCDVQGICCADAHFVNVHISRLEAVSMRESLQKLSTEKQKEIYERNAETIEKYDLKTGGDTFVKTFACPLFEKGAGCLVHAVKPVPCIQHACYERREDLPPDELQTEVEAKIEKLNERTYGKSANWLPLPLWLEKIKKR